MNLEENNEFDHNYELNNFIPHFMKELYYWLLFIKTNDYKIEGEFCSYYISLDKFNNVVLSKEIDNEKKSIRYDITKNEVVGSEDNILLINEFYNLFVKKDVSFNLAVIYKYFFNTSDEIFFYPRNYDKDSKIFGFKKNNNTLSIEIIDATERIVYQISLRIIEGIPNWFIVSKNDNEINLKINRLLTFVSYKEKSKFYKQSLLYENDLNFTEDEESIFNICSTINDCEKYYSPSIYERMKLSDRICPYCKLPLLAIYRNTGDVKFRCQNSPKCKYKESSFKIKMELVPETEKEFKLELLKYKKVKRTFYDKNGRVIKQNIWNASRFNQDSNLITNIKGSAEYRNAELLGVAKIRYEICKNQDEKIENNFFDLETQGSGIEITPEKIGKRISNMIINGCQQFEIDSVKWLALNEGMENKEMPEVGREVKMTLTEYSTDRFGKEIIKTWSWCYC